MEKHYAEEPKSVADRVLYAKTLRASSHATMPEYHEMSVDAYNEEVRKAVEDRALYAKILQASKELDEKGYAVVPSVLSDSEADAVHDAFWHRMNIASNDRLKRPRGRGDLVGFKQEGNWPLQSYDPRPLSLTHSPHYRPRHGIFQDGQWAHQDFVYDVRCHPRVLHVFACIYGKGKGLVVAADRLNYQLPLEWLPRRPSSNPDPLSWIHIDQSLRKSGRHCIQGLVLLEHATQEGDACLEVIPRSHQWHQDLPRILEKDKVGDSKDWYKFTDEDKAKLKAKMGVDKPMRVHGPKGSLILWDSRLMHQGGRIQTAERTIPRPRFVIYVCAQPVNEAYDRTEELEKKQRAFREHKATSHWPLTTQVFPAPQTYGKTPPAFNFEGFLLSLEEATKKAVLAHTFGLKIRDDIDLLGGRKGTGLHFSDGYGYKPPKQRAPKRKPAEEAGREKKKRERKIGDFF